jgi:hypothetical protein
MSDLTFRPRFRIETSLSCEEVESLVHSKLESDNPESIGSTFTKGHFILRIHPSKKHFWSPQMDISIQKYDYADHTVIRCLLAPAPVVWTRFMFFYALTGFGALVGFMSASSQYSLDKDMWGLLMALGSLALGLALFLIAQGGQKLSKDEMYKLRHFIVDLKFPPIKEVAETQKVQI